MEMDLHARSVGTDEAGSWFNGAVLAAILFPLTLYAIVAWQDRVSLINQSELNLRTSVQVVAEQANDLLHADELIGSVVNEHIRGMSWAEIATSQQLHQFLANVVEHQPSARSLWLVDHYGVVRNSSTTFPVPNLSVADRDYFIALREHDSGAFVGRVVHSREFKEDTFSVAERRLNDTEVFDGLVVISTLPSHLTRIWNIAAKDGGTEALVRQDGTVLARQPPVDPDASPLKTDNQLINAMLEGKQAGFYQSISPTDHTDRMFAYQKVSDLGVYIARSINLNAALRTWHNDLGFFGIFFLLATTGLLGLALIATRRLRQFQQTAIALRRESHHRESVEEHLWESQKLEALGRLASQSAHDFGNILSVISGSLDILGDRPNDGKALALAKSATERGILTISALLAFARQKPSQRAVFDPNVVLLGIEGLIRQALGSQIKLNIITTSSPCLVEVDRNQFELAILNIVANARDAISGSGTLTIKTSIVHLGGELDGLAGNFVAITLKDTGHGIAPDILARVLEPFFTTKEPGKGTGLGLSMAYGFSKQSGGTMTIKSTVGSGTSVVIYLATIPTAAEPRIDTQPDG